MSAGHARILEALRGESEALFRINLAIVQLGGEPIPPLPNRLRRAARGLFDHAPTPGHLTSSAGCSSASGTGTSR